MSTENPIPLCEATRAVPAEVSMESDDPNYPFRVCKDVAGRLKACALTPREFFRLAAIHGQDFWLHDDFYDDLDRWRMMHAAICISVVC